MSLFNNLNPIELGERLRIARNNAGITQEVAAQTIQVKRPTFVALEQGKRRIKPEKLTKLANLYQVSCSSLLRQDSVYIDIKPQFRLTHDQAKKADELITSRTLQKLVSSYVELERKLHKPLRIAYPAEYPLTRGQLSEQAEDLSLQVRHGLGLAPISNIMTLLQNELQIRLFIHPLPSKISGMFAYHSELAACVVVNAKHPKTRQAMSAAQKVLITESVFRELKKHPKDGSDCSALLNSLVEQSLLKPVKILPNALELYLDLTTELGDGEASVIAYTVTQSQGAVVIDEKKPVEFARKDSNYRQFFARLT